MKMQVFTTLSIAVMLMNYSHQSTEPSSGQPVGGQLSVLEKSVISSGNSFGFNLFTKVNNSEQNKNVFISPFSVSMAFGMLLNGANGPTLDSLKQALGDAGLSLDDINNSYQSISSKLTNLDATVVFQIANSIWYRFGVSVLPKFLNDNRNYFDAEVDSLDFTQSSAVQTINGWVNTKTKGKIPTILNNIPPDAMMYLINAIYYKGTWTYQFNSQYTKDASFTCADGSNVSCKLMSEEATFSYYADAYMQVIDLPYGNRSFSMTIILPHTNIAIDQFAAGLTQAQWDAIINKLDSSKVDLYLPKFTLAWGESMRDELKALGMKIAFSGAADFSRISQTDKLFISDVIHKTFIDVDERGTEAAAVTIIILPGASQYSPPPPAIPVMRIDHPFIFAIREHQSGTILFIGKIVNPVAS
jgi:serpin B